MACSSAATANRSSAQCAAQQQGIEGFMVLLVAPSYRITSHNLK